MIGFVHSELEKVTTPCTHPRRRADGRHLMTLQSYASPLFTLRRADACAIPTLTSILRAAMPVILSTWYAHPPHRTALAPCVSQPIRPAFRANKPPPAMPRSLHNRPSTGGHFACRLVGPNRTFATEPCVQLALIPSPSARNAKTDADRHICCYR
jgi:hypothetical protein